jgi:hypothetical protein
MKSILLSTLLVAVIADDYSMPGLGDLGGGLGGLGGK